MRVYVSSNRLRDYSAETSCLDVRDVFVRRSIPGQERASICRQPAAYVHVRDMFQASKHLSSICEH